MSKTTTQSTSGEPPAPLISALNRLLRPLVRLLISFGITYPFLSELLKSLYVDVADKEFPVSGKAQTDSRISLLTGVHRKDTKRLRNADPDLKTVPSNISVGGALVAKWLSDQAYQDETKNPRPLPLLISDQQGTSFEELVQAVSKKDIRSRAVLDELIRLNMVHLTKDNQVTLNVDAFVPSEGFEEKAFYFGQNLRDHIAAGSHNLAGQHPPFFDRSVYYSDLTSDSIQTLTTLSDTLAMETLLKLNQKASELQANDQPSTRTKHRINVGIYLFHAEQNDTSKGEK